MTPNAAEVLKAGKQLSLDEQIELIDTLSATALPDPDAHERKWTEECHRRLAELVSGEVQGIPLEEVLRESKELLTDPTVSTRD